MPIRINLLAEQQALEEARRRDPVKRALWVGSVLTALMALWIISLQFKVASAKAEVSQYESRLLAVEENSKEARLNWAATSQLESRIANLQRYSTNRFFCAGLLNALQQVVLDDLRVVQLQTIHTYATNAESTFKTNLVFPVATKKGWSLWSSKAPQTNVLTLVSNQLALITNRVEALKTAVSLVTKVDVSTNRGSATAKIEITRPTTAAEQIVLTIKARDYGNPAGKGVDEFSKSLGAHAYFAERLHQGEGQGIRLRERAIQPELDQADPVSPVKPFVPFLLECRYRPTLRANE